MKRRIICGLTALLLCLVMTSGAMAADEDITDRVTVLLKNEIASVTLYNPTESFSDYGELIFNEKSGCLELTVSAEDVSEVRSLRRSDSAPQRRDTEDGDGGEEDESLPVVKEGYVLVSVETTARDPLSLCMKEEYASGQTEKSGEETEEAAADAEAAEDAETAEEPQTTPETAEEQLAEPTPAPATETPEPAPQPAETPEKRGILGFSARELILLIVALVILLAALAELGVILSLRSRNENVAKNYIQAKSSLDKTKKELTAARSRNIRLERELLAEKNKLSAIKQQFERMSGRKTEKGAVKSTVRSTEKSALPEKKKPTAEKSSLPDLDYLKWTL